MRSDGASSFIVGRLFFRQGDDGPVEDFRVGGRGDAWGGAAFRVERAVVDVGPVVVGEVAGFLEFPLSTGLAFDVHGVEVVFLRADAELGGTEDGVGDAVEVGVRRDRRGRWRRPNLLHWKRRPNPRRWMQGVLCAPIQHCCKVLLRDR